MDNLTNEEIITKIITPPEFAVLYVKNFVDGYTYHQFVIFMLISAKYIPLGYIPKIGDNRYEIILILNEIPLIKIHFKNLTPHSILKYIYIKDANDNAHYDMFEYEPILKFYDHVDAALKMASRRYMKPLLISEFKINQKKNTLGLFNKLPRETFMYILSFV